MNAATDMYQRPSREEIAARVNGMTPPPKPDTDALSRFARHLRGRLRALGWDQAELQKRSGLTAHITSRALNGTGVELATAEKLADLVGSGLAAMIGPYRCGTCDGEPPAGYRCLECGAESRAA